jgi:dihydropteroate synthase
LIMGILNVTPDSFYDGGEFLDPGAAVEQALNLAASGADIIDIGGASSRPGFQAVTAEEELARILPVIKRVSSLIDQPLSVDTEKAEVAAAALDAGASIINDITGLQAPDMVDIAAQTGAPVVIMHNSRGLEHGDDLMGEILCFFRDKITQVQAKGVQEEQIIIDPGLGFGKDTRQNLVILHHLSQLKSLPYPLLIAASQKRFIGDVLDLPLEKRLSGSTAVATLSAAGGAEIVRVHNVLEVKQALKIADAIRRGAK